MSTLDFDASAGEGVQGVKRGFIEQVATFCLFAAMFLLPVFFVPSVSFPFQFSKAILLSVLVLIAFSLWVIARLKDGRFVLPTSPILVTLFGIFCLFLLSSLLSGSVASSLFGQGFEVGTAVNIFTMCVITFLISVLFRSKERVFSSYLVFLGSFFLVALFQIFRLVFGPDFLSLGIFTDTAANLIGKWNDLGVFFGVSALLSLITIEFLSLSRLFKWVVYAALFVSLFFLALVNFQTIWFALGLFSLIFLVYLISFSSSSARAAGQEGEDILLPETRPLRRIPVPSLIVLVISVIFILAGSTIGNKIGTLFNISQAEARPSWSATFNVARQTLIKDPLLGSGPNEFTSEWLKYKPNGINNTVFWNTDFSYGVGLIPTFLATTGILGLLAWIVFFSLFLFAGFKAILSSLSDTFSQYLVTSSFLVSLFLWIFSVFYIPSLTIFALTFFFTGLFIASLTILRMAPVRTISFVQNPRSGFVSVLLLILILIGSITLGYALLQKYFAAVFFQKGIISYNTNGNIDQAEGLIARAAGMSPLDIHYRFLTELTLLRINALLNQNADNVSAESVRTEFQNLLGTALANAREAVALDPTSYQNLMSLGRVYEAVVPLKIEGAYDSALSFYEQALVQNPQSPALHLTIARLEAVKGDNVKARESIARALQQKNNYTEAIFLLSQIEVQEGNIKAAILSVEAATTIAPDDPTLFFQLRLLRFNDKDYKGAAGALERAIVLNPNYANAKYFLGLSYERLHRDAEAIAQFADLKTSNPDNKEVDLILRNLKAGRDPFADAAPPVDAKPEKRTKLPVEDKSAQPKEAAAE